MACESEKAEREAGKLLLSLGGTPNYYGFRYTVYGVALVIREEAYLLALTKRLYPDIARYYQTTRGSGGEEHPDADLGHVGQKSGAVLEIVRISALVEAFSGGADRRHVPVH